MEFATGDVYARKSKLEFFVNYVNLLLIGYEMAVLFYFQMIFQPFPYPGYESSIIERDNLLSVIVVTFIAAEVALSVPFIASIIIEKQTGVKVIV